MSIRDEAERLVVSALLTERGIWGAYGKRVRPELMSSSESIDLVRAMHSVAKTGAVVDLLTVGNYLETHGSDSVDLRALLSHPSEFGNDRLDSAIAILEEEFTRNEVIRIGMDLFTRGSSPAMSGSQLLAEATTRLRALEGSTGRASYDPERGYDHILDVAGGASECVPTGLVTLDAVVGGGLREGLTLIAGRPGHGKTSLALGIALYAAMKLGLSVLFFSLEMATREMTIRVVCWLTGIAFNSIQRGDITSHEKDEIRKAVAKVKGLPLVFDDRSGLTIEEIMAECRMMKSKGPLDLVIIDHIGYVGAFGRFDNENAKLGRIAKQAKAISKEIHRPVICLTQLNRDLEKRADKHPTLTDLRDSGNLEQDADLVVSVYRNEKYYPGTRAMDVDVEVMKQRNGPAGPATDSSGGRRVFFYNAKSMRVEERS